MTREQNAYEAAGFPSGWTNPFSSAVTNAEEDESESLVKTSDCFLLFEKKLTFKQNLTIGEEREKYLHRNEPNLTRPICDACFKRNTTKLSVKHECTDHLCDACSKIAAENPRRVGAE